MSTIDDQSGLTLSKAVVLNIPNAFCLLGLSHIRAGRPWVSSYTRQSDPHTDQQYQTLGLSIKCLFRGLMVQQGTITLDLLKGPLTFSNSTFK